MTLEIPHINRYFIAQNRHLYLFRVHGVFCVHGILSQVHPLSMVCCDSIWGFHTIGAKLFKAKYTKNSSSIKRYVMLTSILYFYVKCMLVVRLIPWKPFACIISENIDPRYLGLYVHHKMLYYTKTQQWYQSHGLFSIILDASCWKKNWKKIEFFVVGTADSMSPVMDSTSPWTNSSNSSSWFLHSTSWTLW